MLVLTCQSRRRREYGVHAGGGAYYFYNNAIFEK